MEGFASILGTLGKLTPALTAGTSLASLVSNMSLASKEKGAMDRAVYYSKHPEAINALEQKFEKPLDAGLVKGTENIVNASMAEQGLSQAPGIQSQVLAQALAPYKQNQQQMAIMEAFKAIGLPAEALSAIQSVMAPQQLALLMKSILPNQGTGQPGGTPGTWNMPDTSIMFDPNSSPIAGPPVTAPGSGGTGSEAGIYG